MLPDHNAAADMSHAQAAGYSDIIAAASEGQDETALIQ